MKAASLTASLLGAKSVPDTPNSEPRAASGGNIALMPKPKRARDGRDQDGVTRVSLRIPSARQLRLRLAAAHLGRSQHGLMLAAIDHYIDTVLPLLLSGHCACIEQGRSPDGSCAVLGSNPIPPEQSS
jgi:hypothetical protein